MKIFRIYQKAGELLHKEVTKFHEETAKLKTLCSFAFLCTLCVSSIRRAAEEKTGLE